MKHRESLAWSIVGLLVSTMLLGGGYQATNLQNGDVNGDGGIDIGDAVYLLAYLFQAGPEPVRVHAQPPASGQIDCYLTASGGVTAPCLDSGTPPGQDGSLQLGAPLAERFVDNGDGTVSDKATGLMWASEMVGAATWSEGLQFCEDFTLAGHTDWRVPNIHELLSAIPLGTHWIAFPGSGNTEAVTWYDPSLFSNPVNLGGDQWVWSSTTSTARWMGSSISVQITSEAFCVRIGGPGGYGGPFLSSPGLLSISKGGGQLPAEVWAVRSP